MRRPLLVIRLREHWPDQISGRLIPGSFHDLGVFTTGCHVGESGVLVSYFFFLTINGVQPSLLLLPATEHLLLGSDTTCWNPKLQVCQGSLVVIAVIAARTQNADKIKT
jgi:hypothetical protein